MTELSGIGTRVEFSAKNNNINNILRQKFQVLTAN